jgi:hypothetical protein
MEGVICRMRQQLENITQQIEDLREEKGISQKGISSFEQMITDLDLKLAESAEIVLSLSS